MFGQITKSGTEATCKNDNLWHSMQSCYACIQSSAFAKRSFLCLKINMIQPKALLISFCPFEVVHQAPVVETSNVKAVFDSFCSNVQVSPHMFWTHVIIIVCDSVFGNNDRYIQPCDHLKRTLQPFSIHGIAEIRSLLPRPNQRVDLNLGRHEWRCQQMRVVIDSDEITAAFQAIN